MGVFEAFILNMPYTKPKCTLQHSTSLNYITLHQTSLNHTTLYYSTVQHISALFYSTVQCSTVLCSTVQCRSALFYVQWPPTGAFSLGKVMEATKDTLFSIQLWLLSYYYSAIINLYLYFRRGRDYQHIYMTPVWSGCDIISSPQFPPGQITVSEPWPEDRSRRAD